MKLLVILFLILNVANSFASLHSCKPNNKQIQHEYYSLCYNYKYKLSSWTSYTLTSKMLKGSANRVDAFKADPMLAKSESPTRANDYKYTGLDRGHLVPAGDMKVSETAMKESFFMTNISPQTPSFNRGVWKRLENKIRKIAKQEEIIQVITGPIFSFKKQLKKHRNLLIPKQYYKIVYIADQKHPKMIAFLLNNTKSNLYLDDFVVTVDEIETLTGIDFFQNLDYKIQEQLESSLEQITWK